MTKININLIKIFYILLLIIPCYSNTFQSPWHLDDEPNILTNPSIHLSNLNIKSIKQTFFAEPNQNDKIYRPIACFTFAINWYIGKDNSYGYHIVNVIIHIITSIFLYKTFALLLQSPQLKKRPPTEIIFIAFLGTTLWAINPIQTQAVTYIVQRMASMGAMFFILALLSYITARIVARKTPQRLLHLFLCGLFFLLSLGCKENAITLIPTLLIVELLFFERDDRFAKILLLLVLAANLFLLLAACHFINAQGYFNSFTLPYKNRPFSIAERLFTQPSILLFYLSLLLSPNPSRLSIDHSFPVSTSILTPWTTLPAIICIVLLLALALHFRKKAPLASFAILFYFVNHLVESSIIPLEMVFEHRNYLPSMFLFLAMAGGLWRILHFTSTRLRLVYSTLVLMIPFLLIANGLGTYSRNLVWASEESLWSDALKKAPDNARTWAKLGIIYGWQKEKTPENLRKSVALLLKSAELDFPDVNFRAALVDNIGKVYARYGLPEESITYSKKALEINDQFIMARIDLADSLQKLGQLEEALNEINKILTTKNISNRFHLIKSTILLWLNKPIEAMESSKNYILASNSNKEIGYYSLGVSLTQAGHHERGRWFLKMAQQYQPADIRIILSLIENSVLAGHPDDAKLFASHLLAIHDLLTIEKILQTLRKDYSALPINIDLITPAIVQSAQENLSKFAPDQLSRQ